MPSDGHSARVGQREREGRAGDAATRIGRSAPEMEGMHVYGPAPAPLAMLRGRHRFRLLVHARRGLDMHGFNTVISGASSSTWKTE